MPSQVSGNMRRSIRYEAARIMAEEGVGDFQRAKRKACARLGIKNSRNLPANLEIEDALHDQLSLFAASETSKLREDSIVSALELMEQLAEFSPMLAGAALSGAMTRSRPVEIHAFAAVADEICEALDAAGLRYQLVKKRLKHARDGHFHMSTARFTDQELTFEVVMFGKNDPYPPLSPVDGRPVRRASLKKVRRLAKDLAAAA